MYLIAYLSILDNTFEISGIAFSNCNLQFIQKIDLKGPLQFTIIAYFKNV